MQSFDVSRYLEATVLLQSYMRRTLAIMEASERRRLQNDQVRREAYEQYISQGIRYLAAVTSILSENNAARGECGVVVTYTGSPYSASIPSVGTCGTHYVKCRFGGAWTCPLPMAPSGSYPGGKSFTFSSLLCDIRATGAPREMCQRARGKK